MNKNILAAVLLLCGISAAQQVTGIPWEEFKALYRERIEMEFREAVAEPETPMRTSLESAAYTLRLKGSHVEGSLEITGRLLSGEAEPIPLFTNELAFTGTLESSGGSLLFHGEEPVLSILPEKEPGGFQVNASFLVPAAFENGLHRLSFQIPPAMRNSLDTVLPEGARLVEAPGMKGEDGRRHFAAMPALTMAWRDAKTPDPPPVIEIDTLSCIHLRDGNLMVSTCFLPVRALPETVLVQLPPGVKPDAASLLNTAHSLDTESGLLTISPAASAQQIFEIHCNLPALEDDQPIEVRLPAVRDNTGREGSFVIEQPDDGTIRVSGEGLISDIPLDRLERDLREACGSADHFFRAPSEIPLQVTVSRFQLVSAPETVLDYLYCTASFEENGNVLTVLTLTMPPDSGRYLRLKTVSGAEIWSLSVNGQARQAGIDKTGSWLIPLDARNESCIELALHGSGARLGLHGRLEMHVPETNLPAREIRIAIGLPPRVDLLSLEGPVSTAEGKDWQLPAYFSGRPYYFSRLFYRGEGMELAVAYREPVKN